MTRPLFFPSPFCTFALITFPLSPFRGSGGFPSSIMSGLYPDTALLSLCAFLAHHCASLFLFAQTKNRPQTDPKGGDKGVIRG